MTPRTASQQTLLEAMSEDQYQNRIVAYSLLLGLRVWHDNDSRRNDAGFPDLVIVGRGGVAFAELKREKDYRVTREQRLWIGALKDAGADAYIWRPSDWPHVQQVLLRLAGRKRPLPPIGGER